MPTGPRKPSILHSPKRRLKLEWFRLKKKWENLSMCVQFCRPIAASMIRELTAKDLGR